MTTRRDFLRGLLTVLVLPTQVEELLPETKRLMKLLRGE